MKRAALVPRVAPSRLMTSPVSAGEQRELVGEVMRRSLRVVFVEDRGKCRAIHPLCEDFPVWGQLAKFGFDLQTVSSAESVPRGESAPDVLVLCHDLEGADEIGAEFPRSLVVRISSARERRDEIVNLTRRYEGGSICGALEWWMQAFAADAGELAASLRFGVMTVFVVNLRREIVGGGFGNMPAFAPAAVDRLNDVLGESATALLVTQMPGGALGGWRTRTTDDCPLFTAAERQVDLGGWSFVSLPGSAAPSLTGQPVAPEPVTDSASPRLRAGPGVRTFLPIGCEHDGAWQCFGVLCVEAATAEGFIAARALREFADLLGIGFFLHRDLRDAVDAERQQERTSLLRALAVLVVSPLQAAQTRVDLLRAMMERDETIPPDVMARITRTGDNLEEAVQGFEQLRRQFTPEVVA